ncbi:sulfite exporter TauE/SafE family protein [Elizabethkingia sp. JS20170427COW]|uniref:sulfite exporter TauE/SafE family protein n=1 Tax=Elizabethkingia sp. JS20170427COW TaxID=2583851 RepID=UPI001110DAAE|nr:sulfite exporter TauE/SafE family protein [Elizabethkingia sp. JS20170427COW]QCX54029.1 sulfite exporter TauE/SafE family protein [Elizabethkingia sp. JS20170427COW]
MSIQLILLFCATIVAFWLSAICGGGASLIIIPILNLLLPASLVPFTLTVGTFTSSVSRIAVFKQHINWKIFLWFVPFSIPAVLLGAYLIKYINPNYLQLIVAFFLVGNLPQLLKKNINNSKNGKSYPKSVLALIGFLAGFISGVTGAIGLLFNRFYLKFGLNKEEIVATRAANEVFLHLLKLVIYISLGLYSQLAIGLGIAIAIATIISSYTVKYILPYLSERVFQKIGYAAMVASGIILFAGTLGKIKKEDKIAITTQHYGEKTKSVISWKNTYWVLEYSASEGLEIEKPIQSNELPQHLKEKYSILSQQYEEVRIERVFSFRKKAEHEFYCYKNNTVTKLKC